MVHDRENDGVPIRRGKPSHEVQGDVQPGTTGNRQVGEQSYGNIFPWAHIGQVAMSDLTSWVMEGHQNRCWRRWRGWARPGWQASWEECPHWRTSEWTDSGMISLLGGASVQLGILSSTSQITDPRTQEDGRMGPGLGSDKIRRFRFIMSLKLSEGWGEVGVISYEATVNIGKRRSCLREAEVGHSTTACTLAGSDKSCRCCTS